MAQTFPLAPVHLVVVFHSVKAGGERSGIAKRAQPHIHAVDKTIGGGVVERFYQPLAEAGEKLTIVEAFTAVGLPTLGVGENQIDIGGKIQFPTAEFTHTRKGYANP